MEFADDDVFLVAVDALWFVDAAARGVAVARVAVVVLVRRLHQVTRVQHEPVADRTKLLAQVYLCSSKTNVLKWSLRRYYDVIPFGEDAAGVWVFGEQTGGYARSNHWWVAVRDAVILSCTYNHDV